jgi:hypothetical protein
VLRRERARDDDVEVDGIGWNVEFKMRNFL